MLGSWWRVGLSSPDAMASVEPFLVSPGAPGEKIMEDRGKKEPCSLREPYPFVFRCWVGLQGPSLLMALAPVRAVGVTDGPSGEGGVGGGGEWPDSTCYLIL